MNKLLILPLLLLMTACTQPSSAPAPVSANYSQDVYRIEGYYAAARVIENAYYDLPRCGQPASPKLCSDLTVLRKVRKADNTAYAAIMQADNMVNTPGFGTSQITTAISAAEAAVNVFTSLATPLKVK